MVLSTLLFLGGLIGLLFICVLIIAPMTLWIWAIVDAAKGEFKSSDSKLVWILLIVLLPFIGTILYLAIGRNDKIS